MAHASKILSLFIALFLCLFSSTGDVNADYIYVLNKTSIVKFNSSGVGTVFANTALNQPAGMVLDDSNKLYVANSGDNNILKYTPSGVMSVFASIGLTSPGGVTVDKYGRVYVENFSNQSSGSTILRYSPTYGPGIVIITGVSGAFGLAVDGAATLFSTGFTGAPGSGFIKKTTFAGVSSFFASGLPETRGLVFDRNGNLYASFVQDNAVKKFDSSGNGTVFVNSGLNGPRGMAFDSHGSLYIANVNNNTVVKMDALGNQTVFAASGLDGPIAIVADSLEPEGLTATPKPGKTIELNWQASTAQAHGASVVGYNIFYSGSKIATVNATTFTVTGLNECMQYCYTVSALNSLGVESMQTDPVCAQINDSAAPPAPGAPTLTAISSSQINIRWLPVTDIGCAGIGGYNVYRDGRSIPTGEDGLSAVDTGLAECSNYWYTVSAYDGHGNVSPLSVASSKMTADQTPPTVPQHFDAEPNGFNEIDLRWDPASDGCGPIRGYYVYRKSPLYINGRPAGPPIVFRRLTPEPVTLTTYKDQNLESTNTYCYTVSAVDGNNIESSRSVESCATLPLTIHLRLPQEWPWPLYLPSPEILHAIEAGGFRKILHDQAVVPLNLTPAAKDTLIAVALASIANEVKDSKTHDELQKLSVQFARKGLQDLKAEGAKK